jgi:hypothetical protein
LNLTNFVLLRDDHIKRGPALNKWAQKLKEYLANCFKDESSSRNLLEKISIQTKYENLKTTKYKELFEHIKNYDWASINIKFKSPKLDAVKVDSGNVVSLWVVAYYLLSEEKLEAKISETIIDTESGTLLKYEIF